MSYDSVMPIVAGVRVPRAQTLQLAALLTRAGFDRTSRILLDAVTNGHEFVALATDDREAMLAVLDHPPSEILVELRTVLFADLNWRRGPPPADAVRRARVAGRALRRAGRSDAFVRGGSSARPPPGARARRSAIARPPV